MGESRWRRVARFRLGNEMREGRYWEKEDKKICSVWRRKGNVGARKYGRYAGNGRRVEEGGRRRWNGCWGQREKGSDG